MLRHILIPITLAVSLAACGNAPQQQQPDEEPRTEQPREPVHVKILAFNDLHGHLEGPSGSVTVQGGKVEAGGADHLVARIDEIRRFHKHTAVVTAGDLVGASPLISALFHDEPTIESMNIGQLDAAAVGNHEFDEGVDELYRLQNGGCHPTDGCLDGDGFEGASFPFLAANVRTETGETLFASTFVEEYDGVKVGFIGLTLSGTPAIVSPEGIKGLSFDDEVETINAVVPKLQEQGVETIVVLIHEGGYATEEQTDESECPGVSGPIVRIVEDVDDAIDVFVTGHTHQAYICEMDGKLVTAAKSYGRLLTEIDLRIDPKTGDVVEKEGKNLVIDRTGTPHPEVVSLIEKYGAIAAPLANKKIGAIDGDIVREPDGNGESPLGRLIADIQLQATKSKERGAAQIAFMNPGGIRDSLLMQPSGEEGTGIVTYAEAHTVQPFGNSLVTMTLTGREIHDLLEAQWTDPDRARLLQASEGFFYQWSASAPVGDKIDPLEIKLNGETIDPDGEYRVTVNSFLANGGDGFALLETGRDRLGGPVDLQALVDHFDANSPVVAPEEQRIKRVENGLRDPAVGR